MYTLCSGTYLCELAQFGRIGLAFFSSSSPDNWFDLILSAFHSLLGFCRCWCESLNQDSRQAIAKRFKIRLFLGGNHQQLSKDRYVPTTNGNVLLLSRTQFPKQAISRVPDVQGPI